MKNENIHDGLEHKNVRDFLAKNLGFSYSGEVQHLEAKIAQLQKDLEKAKQYEVVTALINSNGWKAWDVSDNVSDYSACYFNFLGTAEEYYALLNNIDQEERIC